MLVVSDKRLVPVALNTMIMRDDGGRYYYATKDVYDQLCALWYRAKFGEALDVLLATFTDTDGDFEKLPECAKTFYNTAPAPIKVAALFLPLVKGNEKLETIEDMVAAISVMSTSLNFYQWGQFPRELRKKVDFSLFILEEYKPSYDRFMAENPEYGAETPAPVTAKKPTPAQAQPAKPAAPAPAQDKQESGSLLDLVGSIMAPPTEEDKPAAPPPKEEPKPAAKSGFAFAQGVAGL